MRHKRARAGRHKLNRSARNGAGRSGIRRYRLSSVAGVNVCRRKASAYLRITRNVLDTDRRGCLGDNERLSASRRGRVVCGCCGMRRERACPRPHEGHDFRRTPGRCRRGKNLRGAAGEWTDEHERLHSSVRPQQVGQMAESKAHGNGKGRLDYADNQGRRPQDDAGMEIEGQESMKEFVNPD